MDTGCLASEMQGRPVSMILTSQVRQEDFVQMVEQVQAGRAWRGELFNQRKNGTVFPGHTLVSPILNAKGKVLGFAGLQEDTTQAVALQEELVRAKEFADTASRATAPTFGSRHNWVCPMVWSGPHVPSTSPQHSWPRCAVREFWWQKTALSISKWPQRCCKARVLKSPWPMTGKLPWTPCKPRTSRPCRLIWC